MNHPEHELLARYLIGQTHIIPTNAFRVHVEELDIEGAFYAAARARSHLDDLEPNWVDTLRRAYAANLVENLRFLHDAEEITQTFQSRGIPLALLKGAFLLASGALRDPGTRPMIDLDVLTLPSDRTAVLRTLGEIGFVARHHVITGGKHLAPLRRGRTCVEVHEVAFWSPKGRRFGLGDLLSTRLPSAFTLVHLLHHLYVSSIRTPALVVKTLCDIATLYQHEPEVGGSVDTLARAAGLERELSAMVAACSAGRFSRELVEQITEAPSDAELARRYGAFFLHAILRGPAWLRREILVSVLAPSPSTMEAIYDLPPGSPKVYPAYLVRPFQLAWRALGVARGHKSR